MKTELKTDSQKRLARIVGQVNGIKKMVEMERPCHEILQQIAAARAALDNLGVGFLAEHLQTCVLHRDVGVEEDDCCTSIPESRWSEEIKSSITRFLK